MLFTVHCTLYTASCGFSPLYGSLGKSEAVTEKFNNISIGSIPDRSGQYLRNALIDRFYTDGRPSNADYSLTFSKLLESQADLDINQNATSTREQLRLITTMTLTDITTGRVLLKRDLVSINSFDDLQSQYDTNVSQQYARENALDDLARQVEAQLALYFRRK